MDTEAIYPFFEDVNFKYFTMLFITKKRLRYIVGIFAEETIMDLLELLTEVIISHVEYPKAICILLLLKLFLISTSYNLVPKIPIFCTS